MSFIWLNVTGNTQQVFKIVLHIFTVFFTCQHCFNISLKVRETHISCIYVQVDDMNPIYM